jgi:phosphoribosylformimino-5-aminoimidazole carboxamide ribotide isomerase
VVAGGIRTQQEIDSLDALGMDAVVGMALYSGNILA